jgi:hypothetical protein
VYRLALKLDGQPWFLLWDNPKVEPFAGALGDLRWGNNGHAIQRQNPDLTRSKVLMTYSKPKRDFRSTYSVILTDG